MVTLLLKYPGVMLCYIDLPVSSSTFPHFSPYDSSHLFDLYTHEKGIPLLQNYTRDDMKSEKSGKTAESRQRDNYSVIWKLQVLLRSFSDAAVLILVHFACYI